jgi:transposase
MEDGAPIHRLKVGKTFRDSHAMDVLPHPAQSPDMNPIENIWKLLKEKVNQWPTVPANVEKMQEALLEEWANIDVEYINRLIETMPEHVGALRKAKVGPTKF